jgi:alanyl-tRNA synthetase
MTIRLYYGNSALTTFEAVVRACTPVAQGFDVRLDRTAFYPASGGQPFDTGRLGAVRVLDVVDHGDEVAHIVDGALEPGTSVRGEIDAERRCDHRQQHSGQHVLSAAFERVAGVATVGFHMGSDVSTIDLEREVTPDEIARSEAEANRIVQSDALVTTRVVAAADVPALSLRRPPKRGGDLRIVEIDGVDRSACGGTHVTRTGEIGPIGVIATEKVRGGTRLSFVCGSRAVRTFRTGFDQINELARLLGAARADVAGHVGRMSEVNRELMCRLASLSAELAALRAPAWRAEGRVVGDALTVVRHVPGESADGLKGLVQALVAEPGVVAVLVGDGRPAPLVVARGPGVEFDAGAFVKALASELGGRGGGRPELAQGGMPVEPPVCVTTAGAVLSRFLHDGRPEAGQPAG